MENYINSMSMQSQNRAPNTIQLRRMYNDYVVEASTGGGESPLAFEEWTKTNYPGMKILNQYQATEDSY